MSRFPSESNSPVRVAALTCGTEALCRREIGLCDSATIFCRTPHANEQRTFPPQFQQNVSHCVSWRRLLDHRFRWAPISRCFRAGCGRQHRSRRAGNRAGDGGAIIAHCFRAHLAISHCASGKTCRALARDGSAEFSERRPRLFHVGRFRSNGNRHQTSAPVSP